MDRQKALATLLDALSALDDMITALNHQANDPSLSQAEQRDLLQEIRSRTLDRINLDQEYTMLVAQAEAFPLPGDDVVAELEQAASELAQAAAQNEAAETLLGLADKVLGEAAAAGWFKTG